MGRNEEKHHNEFTHLPRGQLDCNEALKRVPLCHRRNGKYPSITHLVFATFTCSRFHPLTALTAGPCVVARWLNLTTVDFQRLSAVQKIGSIWPFSCEAWTQCSCHFSHLAGSVGMIMVLWKRLMALMIWMVVAFLAKRKSYMWMEAAVYRPPDCLHLQAPGRYFIKNLPEEVFGLK